MTIFILLLGLIIGSFLNVCIYRIPLRESIAWPGSHCPQCGYVLKWYDNIPVISYLLLLGKCRQCRSHITWRYPVVEGLTGLLFMVAYLHYGYSWLLASRLIFICLLVVVALIDMEHFIIPNVVVLPGAIVGLAASFLPGSPGPISGIASGLGLGLFFFLICLVYPKGMGEGDVKLALMLGLWLGWPLAGVTVFLSSLLGTVGGIITIVVQGGGRKTPVPFGFYLGLGTMLTLFYGQQLLQGYLRLIGWQ